MRCGFTSIPSVKASRLSDARGVMLVLPNRDVWTFEALDDGWTWRTACSWPAMTAPAEPRRS